MLSLVNRSQQKSTKPLSCSRKYYNRRHFCWFCWFLLLFVANFSCIFAIFWLIRSYECSQWFRKEVQKIRSWSITDVWWVTFIAWNDPFQELTAFYIFDTFTFSTLPSFSFNLRGSRFNLLKSMKLRIPLLSVAIWQIDLKDMTLLHQSMLWVLTMRNKCLNSNINFSAPELALHVINEMRYSPRYNFPLYVGGRFNSFKR